MIRAYKNISEGTLLLPMITALCFPFSVKICENDGARAKRTKKSFAALMIEINGVTSLVVL